MFARLHKVVDWTFGLLGFQRKVGVEFTNLIFAYNDRLFEIDSLVKGMGLLEKERRELNDIVTTLLTLQGQEEFTLQEEAIQSVIKQGLETELIPNFENKTLILKVQINPALMEMMGGNEE